MNIGARYYKCDLQVHSPRDLQFVGTNCVSDDDRKEYAKKFIKACREKKIDAVALTDHHDLCFYSYLKEASKTETYSDGREIEDFRRIVIFPGLELTLDVPCQALILFDATLEIGEELRTVIYTALLIQNQNPNSSAKSAQHSRLPFKSINEVYTKLNAVESLRNRFIIFPNIKDNGGDSILRAGLHNEYANGVFVGGYLDRGQYDSHKIKVGWNNVINGKVDAYGFRTIGVFQTSDNRIDTFEHLGVSSSWVKWSIPTAEALRQACLSKRSRILQEEPKLPLTRIAKIKISNSSFLRDLEIELNPQFNLCIGGRGTGKSSLLQYISWTLGKDHETEKRTELDRFAQNTLASGVVEVDVLKNGILHSIKRSLASYEIKIGDDNWQPTNSQNTALIIKADSFAQKELSKHEKNRTSQLTKIIENAVDSGVESVRRKLEENANFIRGVASSFEAFLANLKSRADLKTQIESIEEQIKSLNSKLSDIAGDDQGIIRSNTAIEYEKTLIKNSESQFANLASQISNVIAKGNFSPIIVNDGDVKNISEVKMVVKIHDQMVANLKTEIERVITSTVSSELDEAKKSLSQLHANHDIAYAAAKARQTQFEILIKEIEELRKRLAILKEDKQRVEDSILKQRTSVQQLRALYFDRNMLNLELYHLIKKAVADITSKSEGSIEIELTALQNIDQIINKFMSTVTSSKGQLERTVGFFKNFQKGNNTYKQLLKFWLAVYKALWKNRKIEDTLKAYHLPNETLLETDLERIHDSLSYQSIIDLSLELPTYSLTLKYCKETSVKIPFEDASYGQQAGSILTILLNQEFGPLLIDQPEDDLDNKVIHQITENIVSAKHKRQLIFTSHNANIAVNGDAELILAFDHESSTSSGSIAFKGSIDKPEIKRQIKEIMEGGIKAFEMRKVKYGF